MSSSAGKSERIAKNTMLLYGRMLILMVINLYTVRVVLLALGVENYGIYSAVAGVVTMLDCLNGVMSNASQRFFSFYLGKNDLDSLKRVFSCSLDVYLIIVAIVVLLGESAGLWFINNKIVMPEDRYFAGNMAYQFSILAFSSTMISMPFLSAMLAHEKIGAYSFFTTIGYVIRLLFALSLSLVRGDVLIYYAMFEFFAQFSLMFMYIFYSRHSFEECRYRPFRKDGMRKEIITFSGWTLFGSVAGIGMNQLMTILYNVFFGPIVTASRAISLQLNSALTAFSNSFLTAIRPPLIKSYSQDDTEYLNKLFGISNKFVFYSLCIITIPLILEMRLILDLWLNLSDEQTVNFSRLILVYFIIMAMGNPITIIVQAIGKVKEYYLRVEMFTLLCPLVTYILFKYHLGAYYGYVAMIVTIALSHMVRLICLRKLYPMFSIRSYFFRFIIPGIIIVASVFFLAYQLHGLIAGGLLRFASICALCIILIPVLVYFFNMEEAEKAIVKKMILKVTHREFV